jgi:hypothetical protein
VRATHTLHAVPELRIVGGRFWETISPRQLIGISQKPLVGTDSLQHRTLDLQHLQTALF